MNNALKTRLLNNIQTSLPLVSQPYAQIAKEIGCHGSDVIQHVQRLKADGVIREVAAIFNPASLGYSQTLLAFSIPPDKLHAAGQTAAEHPGVSHCYSREGRYNLWLTLALSQQSTLGMQTTVAVLAAQCHATAMLNLPAIKQYKLHVRFGSTDAWNKTLRTPKTLASANRNTSPQERVIIAALQNDLPCTDRPFDVLARSFDMSEDELLNHAENFLDQGLMRRYAAVVNHRAVGAIANVLVAWQVTPDDADSAAEVLSQSPNTSHCYLRPATNDWPYSLYTMIHGTSRDECSAMVNSLATTTGLQDRQELWTVTEYRKRRVRLFSEDEQKWEHQIQT